MSNIPGPIEKFLSGKRIAIAGVSRHADVAANAVFKKLQRSGYEPFAVNPNADEVEGARCYRTVADIPGKIDGVIVATHPRVSADVVRQCAEHGIDQVWFHRSIGEGSVSAEALEECTRLGIEPIVGGCPLMFCEPVDLGHKCMKWWFQRTGKVPS